MFILLKNHKNNASVELSIMPMNTCFYEYFCKISESILTIFGNHLAVHSVSFFILMTLRTFVPQNVPFQKYS